MNHRRWIGSFVLIAATLGTGVGLASWKLGALRAAELDAANQPEPVETVTLVTAQPREHREAVTAIGTVLAVQSITLRNELSGTVEQISLAPGQIVETGTLLLRFDTSVEQAELEAQQARAALAETILERNQRANRTRAVSDIEVEQARAERDVARAQVARTRAIIARKTIRAPFRARVGLVDVHPGQYLDEGTELTTLQGIDDTVHLDFSVTQQVAANLRAGQTVEVAASGSVSTIPGTILALDARVDPATRNTMVRTRIAGAAAAGLAPGAAARVRVPVGPSHPVVTVPVSALRKGPEGDHVFVVSDDAQGRARAHVRPVRTGAVIGDEIVILTGLAAGEQVAASGSFKLRDAVLVAMADETSTIAAAAR